MEQMFFNLKNVLNMYCKTTSLLRRSFWGCLIPICLLFSFNSNALASSSDVKNTKALNLKTIQQKNIVKGIVKSSDGEPLVGVSVSEKGTVNGVITDIDGQYNITLKSNDPVLLFSSIGYASQEVTVGNRTTIDLTLADDTKQLDEVVVLGYQTKTRKSLAGAVRQVDVKTLENRPAARLTDLLAGAAPGLVIGRSDPSRVGGSNFDVQVGGLTTVGKTPPLIVIDGVPQPDIESLNNINPNDVEAMTILSDGEAAIYGSRAAGGVIVIQTKGGKGEAKFTVGVSHQVTTPRTMRKITNMIQSLEMHKDAYAYQEQAFFGYPGLFKYIEDNELTFDKIKNNDFKYIYGEEGGIAAPFPDTPFMVFGHTDWMEEMYGNSYSTNYDFSVNGSSDKISYYFSGALKNEESLLKHGNNSSKTYFSRFKLDYRHSDRLTIGTNISMRYQDLVEPTLYDGIRSSASTKFTWDHPYTREGRYMSWSGSNPIAMAREGGDREKKFHNFTAQFNADYEIVNNLTFTTKVRSYANFSKSREVVRDWSEYFADESFKNTRLGINPNSASVNDVMEDGFSGELSLKYNLNFWDDHNLRALLAATHEEFRYDAVSAWRRKLITTELYTLNTGDSEEQFNRDAINTSAVRAVFANLGYSFKDRYFVEGIYRNDGSSNFAKGYKWKDFYSVLGSWVVTDEPLVEGLGLDWLNNLKLRASWAELGNQASIKQYDFVQQVNVGQENVLFGPSADPVKAQIAYLTGFPAVDRSWEIAKKTNFGIDLGLLDSRFNVLANYYISDNNDVFYTEEFPEVLGATPPSINGAHFKTKGWDLSVNWNDKLSDELSYYLSAGISDANSEVISLADSRTVGYGYNRYVEGYAPGSMFGFESDGIIQNDDELQAYQEAVDRSPWAWTATLFAGDVRFKDLNGDGTITAGLYEVDAEGNPTEASGDMVYLGETGQHYQYNIQGGASWKGLDFSFILVGVGEWTIFDESAKNFNKPWVQPYAHVYGNTWTPDNPDAHYPRFSLIANNFSGHRNNNNYGLSDASFMRKNNPYLAIKNVKIGYRLPKIWLERLKLDDVYVYVNGSDLGYLINKMPEGYVPERAFNANLTPYTAVYSFGVNIKF